MKNKSIFMMSIILVFVMLSAGFAFIILNQNEQPDNSGISQSNRSVSFQERQNANDQITYSRNNLITETVKKATPAVVGISVTEIRQYRDPFYSLFPQDPFFKQFFGDRSYNQEVKNLGSGTIISNDGYILTNDHVAGNATKIVVTMTNGKHYDAKLIGSDPVSDICLLKIDEKNLPTIPLGDSEDIIIGEWVIALGNPFGLFEINDQPTVTVGVISSKGLNLDPVDNRYYMGMIQTDAAINGGNSGGPLVNSVGELIGMNTLIYTAGSQGNIGLGFAIPVNKVKTIVLDLKENGSIDRNFWIGLNAQTIDEGIAKYYNLATTRGVIITNIQKNSPADKAGLAIGDIILDIEGYKITNYQTLIGVFQEFRTGQTINLSILRDNENIKSKMKLEQKND